MPELQDIFREYGEAYRQNHRLPVPILRTMKAIERCRTSELGCHSQVCEDCGHVQISYNSCRNRHCPKCQTLTKERWVSGQKHDLLNVGYFHVVFTIPDTLNTLVFQNQRTLYTILFKAAAESLQELAANPKYLGARIGVTEVLHTWGKTLCTIPISTALCREAVSIPSTNGEAPARSSFCLLRSFPGNSGGSFCII